MPTVHIVLFGPVGVGKSSVLSSVAAKMDVTCKWPRCIVVPEPTQVMVDSGALDALYANLPGSGYRLQMLTLTHRLASMWLAQCQHMYQHNRMTDGPVQVVLSDGHFQLDPSIYLDEHVRAGRMTGDECVMYRLAVAQASSSHACPPDLTSVTKYIHLTAPADTCRARSAARGRFAETYLPADFFTRSVENCGNAAAAIDAGLVVTLNASGPLNDVAAAVHAVVHEAYKEAMQRK